MLFRSCYAVHGIRDFAAYGGGEPAVVRAWGGEIPGHPGVDAWIAADLEFPNGLAAHLESGMTHGVWDFSLRIIGSDGEAYAPEFIRPQLDDRIIVTRGTEQTIEHLGTRSSYTYMLDAFTALVRDGVPMRTDADDAVVTMELIDSIYEAAGMAPRAVTAID